MMNRVPASQPPTSASRDAVAEMFDQIAPTYTLLNHILSLGRDIYWRGRLADAVNKTDNLRLLDLATGTGDLLIELLTKRPNITEAHALDISDNMLDICRRRVEKVELTGRVTLHNADATATGLDDNSFDLVTMAFGIRNTPDASQTLAEIHRILKPGAETLILEFSLPPNRFIRPCYLLYLRRFVPLLGRLLSRHKNAYQYLNTTIESFHQPAEFTRLMQNAGLENISTTPLTFGIVSLYHASKPRELKDHT